MAAQADSPDLPVCRYCLDTEPENELIRPCKCTAPVHASCLCRWLAQGDRDARMLRCELCNGRLRAKWALAPLWSLLVHKEGQSIVFGAVLRGLYSLFLFSRLYKRCKPLVEQWKRPCAAVGKAKSRRAGLLQGAVLCRDTIVAFLLLWLSSQMLVRHMRSFLRMALRFRKAHGRLVLFDGGTAAPSARLHRLRISLRSADGPLASWTSLRGTASLNLNLGPGQLSGETGSVALRAVWEAVARGMSDAALTPFTVES